MPGDDTLIRFGEEPDISVETESKMFKNRHRVSVRYLDNDDKKNVIGFTTTWGKTRRSSYTLQNNSRASIKKIFVDHNCLSDHGGFSIASFDGSAFECINSSTASARYACELEPGKTVTLVVKEKVEYRLPTVDFPEVSAFVENSKQANELIQQNLMSQETLHALQGFVSWKKGLEILKKIEANKFSEHDFAVWGSEKAVPQEVLASIQKLFEKQREIATIQSSLERAKSIVTRVNENQDRLRKNVQSLEKQSQSTLVERYLADMNREEDELILARKAKEQFDRELESAQMSLKAMEQELFLQARKARQGWEALGAGN